MKKLAKRRNEMLSLVGKCRPFISPNQGFLWQLLKYEKVLFGNIRKCDIDEYCKYSGQTKHNYNLTFNHTQYHVTQELKNYSSTKHSNLDDTSAWDWPIATTYLEMNIQC